MKTDLYSLQYFGKNVVPYADTSREIERILDTARRFNIMNNVTGALIYSSGYFAQVLEGPLAAVEDIFEKIQRDNRLRDVTLLKLEPIEARSFTKWSMAYAGKADDQPISLDKIVTVEHLEYMEISKFGHNLIKILHETIKKYESASI